MYQSCSLGGPDGDAYLCAPLGGIGKSAFDTTVANIALFVLAPVLFATADVIRLLMHNSVFVTDECIGWFGDKCWRHPAERQCCIQLKSRQMLGRLRHRPFEKWQSKRVLQWRLSTNWR